MIVDNRRQPRARRLARLVEDEQIERGVIGLPDRVGSTRPVPVNHLKPVAEGGCAFMRQSHRRWINGREDRVDRAVRGDAPALRRRDLADAAANGGG
jgi:hypothetical protein